VDVFADRDRVVGRYADYVRSFFTVREPDRPVRWAAISRAEAPADERSGGFLQAVLPALRTEGRPLTDREITVQAFERGQLRTIGKTPRAMMAACLYTAARNRRDLGLTRLHKPGPTRARRGSVRWTLHEDEASA
jgi:hypothetical protein